jgi:IgA Peptidase M64/Peptidase M64 N-terminus
MTRSIIVCFCLLCWMNSASGQEGYARHFGETTLRVDYYHSGTKGQESFSYDQAIEEGAWPGSRVNLIDTLDLGEYLVRVYDRGTGQLIYSRGFSSMFQEWQTTDEAARGLFRTFSESVRFPSPRHVVQVTIARRDRYLVFHELFSAVIDPANPTQVSREKGISPGKILPIIDNGPPATKVDILILGDGYSAAEMDKFRKDARHFTEVMFQTSPFDKRKNDFNVRALEVASAESGIDMPDKGVWKATALGCSYNTFGSARYVLTSENKRLRDIAGSVPYDFLCILVNDTRYGGGGIFQLYATTYTGERVHGQEWQMDYVYVHEFGHSFGGLGDEYYTSSTAYNDMYPAGVEPWEPNITSLGDPKDLKWKQLVTPGVGIPTPWEKAQYDSIEAIRGKLDRLAPDYYEKREPLYRAEQKLLHESAGAGKVGAFEGAGYATKGLFRPALDCRMFSLSTVGFDPVCGAAIERMIDFYSH